MQDGRVVVDEQQDIVYRQRCRRRARGGQPRRRGRERGHVVPPAAGEWAIEVSPTLLFRFSALTYNAHRIHYDRDYVRDAEGYPGPADPRAAAGTGHGRSRPRGRVAMATCRFEYRLISPLFDFQGLVVSASRAPDATATAVRDIYGRRTATGTLTAAGAGPGS